MQPAQPQDLAAEQALLGCCLISPYTIDDLALVVEPGMFFGAQNGVVFQAILSLHNREKGVDVVTLGKELKRAKQLEEIGGPAYLATLMAAAPMVHNAIYYAEQVRDAWSRREGIQASLKMHRAFYDESQSAPEALELAGVEFTRLCEAHERGQSTTPLSASLMKLSDLLEKPLEERPANLFSGIGKLDELTTGFGRGQLIIIAARPSVGKTAFALNLIERWCEDQHPVLFASAEQSKMELAERLLSMSVGMSIRDIQEGRADAIQLGTAFNQLHEWPLVIDDRGGPKIGQIESLARIWKRKQKIEALVVDYLQLVEPSDASVPREQQVSSITRRFKAIAKALDIPVFVLCQLNREAAKETSKNDRMNGRPRLHHLRESGAIEQDADKVLFLWRPFRDEPDHIERTLTMLEVAKNRNGPIGIVELVCREECFRFREEYAGADVGGYSESRWEP